jgi:hypothetical protein
MVSFNNTRIWQKNLKTSYLRQVARFDRACPSKKPKQASLIQIIESNDA